MRATAIQTPGLMDKILGVHENSMAVIFAFWLGYNSVLDAFQLRVEWPCLRGAVFHLREVALRGLPQSCVTASKALWTHVFT